MENVVIIGSGCAGLTAALYTARANLRPLVLTGLQPGGLLTTTTVVENFPGFPDGIDGYELMSRMQKQAEKFGARVQFAVLEQVELSRQPFALTVDGGRVETETLIIASGASHRHLGLESERKLENKGVTYCATCDGALPMFRDQPLVVVGGGDSACEEASYLTRFGSEVHLIHRRDELRASKIMQKRAMANPKVAFEWNAQVVDVRGTREGGVEAVVLEDTVTGERRELRTQGLFLAIGHKPNTELFVGHLKMDDNGYLITAPDSTRTSVEGVFACGDVQDHVFRQAVTAAGSGCMAAIEAERWLAEHEE